MSGCLDAVAPADSNPGRQRQISGNVQLVVKTFGPRSLLQHARLAPVCCPPVHHDVPLGDREGPSLHQLLERCKFLCLVWQVMPSSQSSDTVCVCVCVGARVRVRGMRGMRMGSATDDGFLFVGVVK